jgi:mono/diheme cytochrome c family protein
MMIVGNPTRWPQLLLRKCLGSVLLLSAAAVAPAEDLSTSSGAQLFRQYCASCHGRQGQGDGPVAPFFKLLPPDLTLIARRSGGVFPAERVRRIIDGTENLPPHGARQMPVWGLEFAMITAKADGRAAAEATIARLVEHLRTMQRVAAPNPGSSTAP